MGRMKESLYVRQVAAACGIVAIECLVCTHRGFIPAGKLAAAQQDKPVHELRARCSSCKSTMVRTRGFVPC